jgi:UDP-2,3-diacylglucosamine pyrophosphatase LpxH
VFDALILSDIHLGSSTCQARSLRSFLEQIAHGEIATRRLILNGDVFDSIDFRRLGKHHWKVLSLIRKLSDQIEIIWLCGNHDGSADIVSHLLGVTVKEEFILRSGGDRILVLHGHIFDDFIDTHPVLTWLADCIYLVLQHLDRTHTVARLAKKGSKTFIRCARKIREGAVEHARRKQCSAVCCGHTHQPLCGEEHGIGYFNSGCWTESPSTYLTVVDGVVELHAFEPYAVEEQVDEPVVMSMAQ